MPAAAQAARALAIEGLSPSLGELVATETTSESWSTSVTKLASTRLAPTSMNRCAPMRCMVSMLSTKRTGEAICLASRSRLARMASESGS